MANSALLARRFAVFCALGLWIGGTTLYTGFVIKIAHRLLPGGKFGLVTRDVTGAINLIGVAALAVLLVNLVAEWRPQGRIVRWGGAGSWAVCALTLGVQFGLRSALAGLMGSPDRARFDRLHEAYEMATAIQWFAGMVHGGCVLAAWRRSDGATRDRTG